MKKYKIGFIGTGNIATAIFNGITSSGYITHNKIMVFDTDSDKAISFLKKGSVLAKSAVDLVTNCEYVFLTVKPQIYPVVLSEIKEYCTDVCLVDVAAGISVGFIKELLGFDAPVVRVMPNTPISVGMGSTALVKEAPVTDEQFDYIKGCFESCGITAVVDEDKINTVIALSGSSPAYIMRLVKIISEYGAEHGLSLEDSKRLAVQTFEGCAKMIKSSDDDISTLISNVTSPNGTTFEGLKSLDSNSFDEIVCKCLDATVRRAEELSK